MNPRDRIREPFKEALASQHIESVLKGVLEDLVTRIHAEPELRRQVIRESVRSSIISTFWMHP
jgi:hypothetical protein